MIIEVTAQDIKNGIRRNSNCCPVSFALQRETGYKWTIGKFFFFASDHNRHVVAKYPAPASVWKFIKDFDMNRTVEPFSFELPEPFWHWQCKITKVPRLESLE